MREVLEEANVDVEIEEVMPCGVMSAPAIVVDEHVVHAGGIPNKAEVRRWVMALSA